jgi:hypothetical protein
MTQDNQTNWQVTRRTEKLAETDTEAHFRQRNPHVVLSPEKRRVDRVLDVVHTLLNEGRGADEAQLADVEGGEGVG